MMDEKDICMGNLVAPVEVSPDVAPCAPVLDACCGSRMFWFNREDPRAVFMDCRQEVHELTDKSSAGGKRTLVIAPDVVGDFRSIPYQDNSFRVVCFDPPHLVNTGPQSWLGRKYGTLPKDWQDLLRRGFAECFRVLEPLGVLVFKWNEDQIPVSRILALTDAKPLFGNRCGKHAKSHWIVFLKDSPLPPDSPCTEKER